MFLSWRPLYLLRLSTHGGGKWRGNFESLLEALYLGPPVFPTLESAKALYRWCFWTALSRPDMVLNQSYRHPTAFFHVITFLIIASSACFLYELGYLCYTGTLDSSWDRAIPELGYHWSRGGWRLAFPSHWAMREVANFEKWVRAPSNSVLPFCSWSCMFAAFSIISTTLFTTALYSWGQRWRGNLESLVESLFLQPVVLLVFAAKAFYYFCLFRLLNPAAKNRVYVKPGIFLFLKRSRFPG